jgi:DNA-binding CsgD family transcriptional regulator
MQIFTVSDPDASSLEAYTQLIMDFLGFGQTLCKQTQRIGEQLCQEVMRATQGRARLLLPYLDSSAGQQVPFAVSVSFQVQFNSRSYGTLDIAPDSKRPVSPALPLHVAQLLAQICGLLLCTIELSVFIERQCQRFDHQNPGQLTRREREVLELICRGLDQQTIATRLDITLATADTYRKRIYGKLGVHSERDVPLAAYQANLISILEESRPNLTKTHQPHWWCDIGRGEYNPQSLLEIPHGANQKP